MSAEDRWRRILAEALKKYLRGRQPGSTLASTASARTGGLKSTPKNGRPTPATAESRIVPLEDIETSKIFGFDRTGRVLYLADNRDTSALTAFNLDTGEQTVIAADARADVNGVMAHPTERTLQAVDFIYERREYRILDDSIAPDMEYLRTAVGDFQVISRTLDDSRWIVVYPVDDGPRATTAMTARKEATFLFTHAKELEGLPLAKLHRSLSSRATGWTWWATTCCRWRATRMARGVRTIPYRWYCMCMAAPMSG